MKNFFQRKPPDPQPSPRSNNPNNPANEAYRTWLPPPNASDSAPAPGSWAPTTAHSSARRGGETHPSSSRVPRADAASVPTSSAYKYATLPNHGLYAQPVPVPAFPPQYHPRPSPDRPDSRLGYAYPHQNSQHPRTSTAPPPSQPERREDKTGSTVAGPPAQEQAAGRRKHSDRDGRTLRKPSSSSLREDVEEKKRTKHKQRDPPETRKRRDSQLGDPYAEKRHDRSSRKESRRTRAEEGDSSDSSAKWPSSSGYRRRADERKSSPMMNNPQQASESAPFPTSSRTGLPIQPTTASSSSGKYTPQNPRMPVYLPASHGRSQRPDEGQLGLSESDTDHGTFNRGRNFLRGTALPNVKQQVNLGGSSTVTTLNKKVKESKGLWPFSRSKSSQNSMPVTAPPTAVAPARKTRADSSPSPFTQIPAGSVERPEYRRHASDNPIHVQPHRETGRAVVPPKLCSPHPEVHSSSSRAMFFAAQPDYSSSDPLITASQQAPQQAALKSFQSRSPAFEALSPVNPGAQATTQNPGNNVLQGQFSGPNLTQHPETLRRRDGRDSSLLPPIYAPSVARASDYPPQVQERSTTPTVSQLVAGFEARSETQPHVSQQVARPPPIATRQEIFEQPPIPRIYPSPQEFSQGPGKASTSQAAVATHALQPPSRPRTTSDTSIRRPIVDGSSSVQKRPVPSQPDILKTQLRDLLTDKPVHLRNDEKVQPGRLSESRNNQTHAPPSAATATSQHVYAQPPVHVFSVGTSLMPTKPAARSEKPSDIAPPSKPRPRRADVLPTDSADRSRAAANRDDGRDTHARPARSKKDTIAIMKTPSKDSSRHSSSPSPVIISHSANQSHSNGKSAQSSSSASASRSHPPPPSSFAQGDRISQRDHRPAKQQTRDPPTSATPHATGATPYATGATPRVSTSTERVRPVPSAPTPTPCNAPSAGRTTIAPPSSTPSAGTSGASGSRSTVPSGNSRVMQRKPSAESILKTPSSLAHSVLPPSASRTSIPASVSSDTRKKGIFDIFRSKESQQSEAQVANPLKKTTDHAARTRSDRGPHTSSDRGLHPNSERSPQSSEPPSDHKHKPKVPPPIAVPDPTLPAISDRKSPNSRVFSPFRYLTSKRNRRISTASMDAVDGTAPNTVMGSPTASMQSSQIPPQSPPQRDPRVATQDWRNQEESDILARGKPRRMRPGVVFDVAENPLEESKRSRPMRVRKSQPQAEAPTTDSSG
ncbi:hypothetical protein C8R47DRAFT_348139 [Mycena vitilis]|nr:hypothetical protein C8R47DRAFT_348139 [Mycena vitilis]